MNWLEIKGFNKGIVSTSLVGIGRESDGVVRLAQNVRLKSGNVVTREGYDRYCDFANQAALQDKTIRSLGEYQRESWDGTNTEYWRVVVFTADGTFWYVKTEDSTDHAVQITGHPQSSNNFHYVNVYDHLWIFDRIDPVYVWDGIAVRKAGIPAPTGLLSAHINTGGAGVYSVKYKLTYFRSAAPHDKESDPTDEITLANLDSSNINNHVVYTLGAGEVIDSQVTHVHVYRSNYWDPTADEEPTDFYLLTPLAIAAFVTAGHQYTDDAESVTNSTPYDVTERGVPPVSQFGLWQDSRLFVAGDPENPSVVYYSEIGKPWYFPALNYDEVNRDDGSIITGLGAIGPTRYIFKEHLIYEWTGNPLTATPIRQVERPDATQNMARVAVGCAYSDTLVGWNNSLIFRAYDGDVYMLTQESLTNLSKYYEGVRDIDDSCAAYVKDDYYIIGGPTGSCACYLPNQSWESADDIRFSYALVRQNGMVLVPDSYLQDKADPGDPDVYIPALNRLHHSTQDNDEDFTKSVQTKYIKVADNDDTAIIRAIRVYATANIAYYMTVINEKGENVVGLYDTTLKRFNLGTPLYAKWVSVRLSWSTPSSEIFGVDVGYIKRGIH